MSNPDFSNVESGVETTAPTPVIPPIPPWQERERYEIKEDEGCLLKKYKDSLGNYTIGYGHLTTRDTPDTITQQQAEEIFNNDFDNAVDEARRAVPCFDGLQGARKGVMVNMAFNMGERGLASFHGMLDAMDDGDYDSAALHLMNSRYARQVKSRANRLAYRLRTNKYAKR